MSLRYKGGVISATAPSPSSTSASGIWTLENQMQAQGAGTWPAPFTVSNSLRLRASASAYLQRTPSSTTDRQKFTMSFWVKRGITGSNLKLWFVGTSSDEAGLQFYSGTDNDAIEIYEYTGGGYQYQLQTTQLFRDVSAWYHFVVAVDTTQATAANRVKFYVNGSQVTAFATANYPTQNYNTKVNVSGTANNFSKSTGNYFDGYLAEINFIDGQQLTPSSFGTTDATTGVWTPQKYSGTYGTNGYYLPFSDTSALTTSSNVGLGKDFSGNGNYFSTNNISITSGSTYDAMKDVPSPISSTVGNFPTLNPIYQGKPGTVTINEGNLKLSFTSNPVFGIPSTMCFPSTGKWYCEVTAGAISGQYYWVGITDLSQRTTAALYPGNYSQDYSYGNGALKANNNSTSAYGSTWGNGDVIGIAVDCDAGTIEFYKNGSSQGTAFTGLTSMSTKTFIFGSGADSGTLYPNFGQRPFAYSLPSGYLSLNTYNLTTPTILQGDDYFAATIYTGTGSSNSVNVGFQPSFSWAKARSAAYINYLFDAVRGADKYLISNATDAEYTGDTAFTSTGFSMSSDINANGTTYVSWNWKGNGSGVSNTDGSITSTVSANTTSKCSIVTYTGNGSAGATIGHGLGATPAIIIVKRRDAAANWPVLLKAATTDEYAYLNLTNKSTSSSNESIFGNNSVYVAPTSTVFTVGTNTTVNANGGTYVAYLFSSVSGFSAFGNYTGNGSSNGPFVYCGFRPAYVIVKNIDALGDWPILDNARDTYNVEQYGLYANTSGSESNFGSPTPMYDFLSNGFKVRNTYANTNTNGSRYAYMAFAENPFKYALAR